PPARGPRAAGRGELPPTQAVAGLRAASGHGGSGPRADDAFDVGALRVIALDTVRRRVGSGGVPPTGQIAFLRRELARAGARRVIVVSHQPLTGVQGGARAL